MQPPDAANRRQSFTLASAPVTDSLECLSSDFSNLFSAGHNASFSDVVFCVEGKKVHAHRCILAARSTFFRMILCEGIDPLNGMAERTAFVRPDFSLFPIQVPVGNVSYDVLLIVLQYLYSGQLILAVQQGRSKCMRRGCWHAHCSAHVDLAFETLQTAKLFGLDQLCTMIQRHFESILDKISIDDMMRVLVSARKQGLDSLWVTSLELVTRSGLTMETLKKHLPHEIAAGIEELRLQRCSMIHQGDHLHNSHGCSPPLSSIDIGMRSPVSVACIRKMQQALDSLDIELVHLMVMGEGLDLDLAHALHYTVGNCSRDMVKALLEMGGVNANHPDRAGRTALHIASEMANPEMISVLLDHQALPLLRTDSGDTPIDIIQELISALQTASPTQHQGRDHNRLSLCLELLQSAACVADKEDESSNGAVTERSSDNTSSRSFFLQNHHACRDIPDCSSSFEPLDACAHPGITTPVQLSQDWAALESSSSFEHGILSSDHLEASNIFQQQDENHHPGSVASNALRMDATAWRSQAEPSRGTIMIDKGNLIDGNRGSNLQLSPSVSVKYSGSSVASDDGNYSSGKMAGYMEDSLYEDFQMQRPQPALFTAAFFETANRSTIF